MPETLIWNFASAPASVVAATCASFRSVTVVLGYALPEKTTLVAGATGVKLLPPPPPPPPLDGAGDAEVHADVLNSQDALQLKVPLVKPRLVQDAPPRAEPSHCSPEPMMPSPQRPSVTVAVMLAALTFAEKSTVTQMMRRATKMTLKWWRAIVP